MVTILCISTMSRDFLPVRICIVNTPLEAEVSTNCYCQLNLPARHCHLWSIFRFIIIMQLISTYLQISILRNLLLICFHITQCTQKYLLLRVVQSASSGQLAPSAHKLFWAHHVTGFSALRQAKHGNVSMLPVKLIQLRKKRDLDLFYHVISK